MEKLPDGNFSISRLWLSSRLTSFGQFGRASVADRRQPRGGRLGSKCMSVFARTRDSYWKHRLKSGEAVRTRHGWNSP